MVDEEVVITGLKRINQYTNELIEMRGMDREEYLNDIVLQRAVERTLMNLIQSCIDLASHIRASEEIAAARTSKEEIESLGNADIITAETQAKLEEAVGFRNVLAHRYGELDHDIVYDVLHDDLHWFERFQHEVAEWLLDYR